MTYQQADSLEKYIILGISGPTLTCFTIYLLKIARQRLIQMRHKKYMSLNVLNIWIYKWLIMGLVIQVIISIYSTILIVTC